MENTSFQKFENSPTIFSFIREWLSDINTPFVLIFGLLLAHFPSSKIESEKETYKIPFLNTESIWVDTLLENMTLDEKIGQLIMIELNTNDQDKLDSVDNWLDQIHPGGLLIQTDSINKHAELVNFYQANTQIPLLIGLESDKGYPDYLKDLMSYGSNFSLCAINNDSLISEFGKMIAHHCNHLGVHINFYPFFSMIDRIYPDYDSLYIEKILRNSLLIIKELQNKSVIACINDNNYFPEIYNDSMSIVRFLNNPYNELISNGVSAISVKGHSNDSAGKAIYQLWLDNYLGNELSYEGLNISRIFGSEMIDEQLITNLFGRGSDLLVVKENVSDVVNIIVKLVEHDVIKASDIDYKVRKILLAKSWAGLEDYKPINVDSIEIRLNNIQNQLLSRQLIESSITVVQNNRNTIPLKHIGKRELFIYTIGPDEMSVFKKNIFNYSSYDSKHIVQDINNLKKIGKISETYNTVILVIDATAFDTAQLAILDTSIKKLKTKSDVILVNLGDPKILTILNHCEIMIQAFDNSKIAQELTAQLIFGGIAANGVLPYNVSDNLKFNHGIKTPKTRLKYTIPEEVGISSLKLHKIDSIIQFGIRRRATPGCQVFIAKDGKVIYNKAFGSHTYSKQRQVKINDLYDIASITKVAGTTLAAMKLYDDKEINLNKKLGEYFSNTTINYINIRTDTIMNIDTLYLSEIEDIDKILEVQDTIHLNDSMIIAFDTLLISLTPKLNIFKVKLYELLTHKSGISPSMPILPFVKFDKDEWLKDSVLNDTTLSLKQLFQLWLDKYYCYSKNDSCNVQIANKFYLKSNYVDSLWEWTKQIRVYSRKIYQYGDANMILLQMAIDSINKTSIDSFLMNNFYESLGLRYICYRPLDHFSKRRIIPTEEDDYWRRQLVHGHVHDPTAALLGGVAGNAGIFSNANDLGILFQMLLNDGIYGGTRYIKSNTVKLFTSRQPDSYRGLGFDIPGRKSVCAKGASNFSFGHTGFTGTCVWVDKKEKLVYVFLSNRVNPSIDNWRLNSYRIRQNVHQVIYDCLQEDNH